MFCKSLVKCQVQNLFWKGLEQSDSWVSDGLWMCDFCVSSGSILDTVSCASKKQTTLPIPRISCWTVPVEGRKIYFIVEAKGILEQTSMPIVSLQNLLKHQQRAEGIPFSPLKCLIVGGLTRGDTWRGFFGISAENWVNLYSEVLHLKIGRAPKSGKFRWSSICYSGAFRMLSWSIIKRVRGPSSAWCFFF